MTQDIDMPAGVEAALRSALIAAFDAGRKGGTQQARDTVVRYGVDRVANAWIMARVQEATAP